MFGRGIALGFAIASTLVFAWAAYEMRSMEAMFRDFGSSATLPALTRFVIHRAWLVGGPIVSAAVVGALGVRRPSSFAPYVVAAAAIAAAAVLTWYGARLPIFELAGNIK